MLLGQSGGGMRRGARLGEDSLCVVLCTSLLPIEGDFKSGKQNNTTPESTPPHLTKYSPLISSTTVVVFQNMRSTISMPDTCCWIYRSRVWGCRVSELLDLQAQMCGDEKRQAGIAPCIKLATSSGNWWDTITADRWTDTTQDYDEGGSTRALLPSPSATCFSLASFSFFLSSSSVATPASPSSPSPSGGVSFGGSAAANGGTSFSNRPRTTCEQQGSWCRSWDIGGR